MLVSYHKGASISIIAEVVDQGGPSKSADSAQELSSSPKAAGPNIRKYVAFHIVSTYIDTGNNVTNVIQANSRKCCLQQKNPKQT